MRSQLVLLLASVSFAHEDSTGESHTHSPRPVPSDATTDPPVIKLVLAPPTPDDPIEPTTAGPDEPAAPVGLSIFEVTTFAPNAAPRPSPTIKPVTLVVGDVVVNNPGSMTEESNEMDPDAVATEVPIFIDIPAATGDGGTTANLVNASFIIETPTGAQTPDSLEWPVVETTMPDETPQEGDTNSEGPGSLETTEGLTDITEEPDSTETTEGLTDITEEPDSTETTEGRTDVSEGPGSTETTEESEATDRESPDATTDGPEESSTTPETPEEPSSTTTSVEPETTTEVPSTTEEPEAKTEVPSTTEEPQSPESPLVSGAPNAMEGGTDTSTPITPLDNTTTATTMDPMCASHSACEALDGACCPNSSPDAAVFLSCCGTGPVQATCTDNPECSALELEGVCCPTSAGVYLDCCAVVPDDCGDGGECVIESALEYKALLEQQAEESASTAADTSGVYSMGVGFIALFVVTSIAMTM